MRFLLLLCAFCFPAVASEKFNECFSKEDEGVLAKQFQKSSYQSDYLFKMIHHTVDQTVLYELYNQHKELIHLSSKRWYDLDTYKDEYNKYRYYTFPKNTNLCVWEIHVGLPDKLAQKCDDGGAYGPIFSFRKINGEIKLVYVSNELGYHNAPVCEKLMNTNEYKLALKTIEPYRNIIKSIGN